MGPSLPDIADAAPPVFCVSCGCGGDGGIGAVFDAAAGLLMPF